MRTDLPPPKPGITALIKTENLCKNFFGKVAKYESSRLQYVVTLLCSLPSTQRFLSSVVLTNVDRPSAV